MPAIFDGDWHPIKCSKVGDTVELRVDNTLVATATAAGKTMILQNGSLVEGPDDPVGDNGTFDEEIKNDAPVSIGGIRSDFDADGDGLDNINDQFHGDLDNLVIQYED